MIGSMQQFEQWRQQNISHYTTRIRQTASKCSVLQRVATSTRDAPAPPRRPAIVNPNHYKKISVQFYVSGIHRRRAAIPFFCTFFYLTKYRHRRQWLQWLQCVWHDNQTRQTHVHTIYTAKTCMATKSVSMATVSIATVARLTDLRTNIDTVGNDLISHHHWQWPTFS